MDFANQAPKKKYRILHVFSSLGVGGAETWLMALLRYFDSIKNELPFQLQFDICLTSGNRGVFDDEAISLGARLFYPRYSRNNLLNFIREFRTILKFGNYDAIHDHQDYTSGFHFLFGIGRLPPVRIAHIHTTFIHIDNYSSSHSRRLTAASGKKLLAYLATHIIGTSRQIVSEYGFYEKSFNRVQRDVVHCGFDVSRFCGDYEFSHDHICREFDWEKSARIVLFVGRLSPINNTKNPEFALEVARQCIENDSRVCFLMAGDGDDVKLILQERVSSWGLEKSIRIIGARSDIPILMSGSDLLLFPSVAEGLGMVAVEAQAAGLHVLASDTVPRECAVIPEMLEFMRLSDGATGWAEEALRLLNLTPADPVACSQAIMASPFSIENSSAALLKIYTGLEK